MPQATLDGAACFAVVASRPVLLEALMCSALTSGIAACTGVSRGSELVRHIARSVPDVLLLDVDLDGRHGGVELLRHGRLAQAVTTVLVADHIDASTLALARETRAVGVLAWPCSQAQLDATLCLALVSSGSDPASADRRLSHALGTLRRIAREHEPSA